MPFLAINTPYSRKLSHTDYVTALRNTGQVNANVMDIRGR